MASDGVTLYWLEAATANLVGMPVQGGPTSSIATNCSGRFLAVDSTSVYFLRDVQLCAAPKSSGATALVLSDRSGSVTAAAVVGSLVFWAETPDQQPRVVAVKSASLAHAVASVVGQFPSGAAPPFQMGVTRSNVFLNTEGGPVTGFSLDGGAPDGGPPQVVGSSPCGILVSDESAAYCVPLGGPVTRIADDGTTTVLTTASHGTAAAMDGTFLYFADKPAPGALLLKVSKLGGTPTVIAYEEATALAVDDTAIYWATPRGYIRRLLK
jgi:hypothetical protein